MDISIASDSFLISNNMAYEDLSSSTFGTDDADWWMVGGVVALLLMLQIQSQWIYIHLAIITVVLAILCEADITFFLPTSVCLSMKELTSY